jgi:hypothetical protein
MKKEEENKEKENEHKGKININFEKVEVLKGYLIWVIPQ